MDYLIRGRTLRLGGLRPSLPRLPVDRCSFFCSFLESTVQAAVMILSQVAIPRI